MPFPVKDLLQDRSRPVAVDSETSMIMASETMQAHDFSQLPIVDREGKVLGIISSDSIVEALSNFDASIHESKVNDARKHPCFSLTMMFSICLRKSKRNMQ